MRAAAPDARARLEACGLAYKRALTTVREIYSQTNPFRFIVYSEWAGRGLAPVVVPPAGAASEEGKP